MIAAVPDYYQAKNKQVACNITQQLAFNWNDSENTNNLAKSMAADIAFLYGKQSPAILRWISYFASGTMGHTWMY